MRRRTRNLSLAGTGAGLLLLLSPAVAGAQSDTEPPLPNVMLLIDSSGSMEYLPGAVKDPVSGQFRSKLPNCAASVAQIDPNKAYEQNRWATLATVLTGEIPKYACVAESRSTPAFKAEFGEPLGNGKVALYDADYYLPYNRIVSTNGAEQCVVGPNRSKWPGANPFVFDTNAVTTHKAGDTATACTPVNGSQRLVQVDDGLLDVFREKARFGLMTFDGSPDQRTGYAGNTADMVGGMQGLWSYYPGWLNNDPTFAKGLPAGCLTGAQTLEVGARNPAAPPWEGRMMNFGPATANMATITARNELIQQAILAVRPYGATPLAGLMTDAEYYFTKDTSLDKSQNGSVDFGPYNDPYVKGGCRKQFIILLTDGLPNLDLRDACSQGGPPAGQCPYSTPSEVARRLYNDDPQRPVQTFVVGFSLSSAKDENNSPIDCRTLTGNNDAACAAPKTDDVRACCEMAKIAYNGGTIAPRFADSKPELRKAINDILSQVAQSTTSRTTPVFASAGAAGGGYSGGENKIAAYNLLTSFKVSTGGLWEGVIERQRYTCRKSAGVYNVKAEDVSTNDGDRFHQNLKSGSGPERRFYTATVSGSNSASTKQTIRQLNSITDGLGALQQAPSSNAVSSFYGGVPHEALQLSSANAALSVCGSLKSPVSEPACRDRILRWYTGLPMIDGSLYDRVSSPLGSIFHSTPVVVGAPAEYVRDDSYSKFADTYKNRTPITYVSTTDGQLHAFKLGASSPTDTNKVDSTNNNELWSFIPPAVLPDLKSIYPGIERPLLDTPIVARDVVFERKRSDAVAGSAAFDAWRTVLTTGFGPSVSGYFSLDITDPDVNNAIVKPATNAGPKFLWQITGDKTNQPLFGRSTTPVITTVFVKAPGASEATEIAVAILPGGASPSALSALESDRRAPNVKTTDGKWSFRNKIRTYSDDDPSRSVTIVRLDTGEVIRRFHRCKANSQPPRPYDSSLLARSQCADFDSPLTAVPLAYPNGTGQAATRVFLGDQDGTMWRLDMSNPDPATWSVKQFFDGYAFTTSGTAGQPILSQPVASLDPLGNLVVIFSTGEQDRFDASPGVRNVLWSVRESPDFALGKVGSVANWHLGLNSNEVIDAFDSGSVTGDWNNGIRVAGPLSLFNGAVYFSTYQPPAPGVNACDPGTSVLWAVDYLKNRDSDVLGNAAPVPALPKGDGTVIHAKKFSDALIFGVGIQKLPACYDTSTISDPYLGFGTGSTTVSDMTKPEYNLVVQTGAKGKNISNAETKFERIQLQPPPSGARISSWAAVVE